ncbi:MAG: DUF3108 domain-containing protein [Leptospiraceae bacterium]|nr:DUF3108 domain-containing protein [Leptospiraceae bacterium]MDW7977085.1 DUF3108 domain-containing protein [Leptospiraceae bacterium]
MKKLFIFTFITITTLKAHSFYEYKYKIYWKGILVGYSSLGIYGMIDCEKEQCYVLKAKAHNTKVLQYIYPVNNYAISYWNPKRRIPIYSEKSLNEGRYHRDQKTYFSFKTQEITWYQREFSGNVKNRQNVWKHKEGVTTLLPNTQDILSAIFFLQLSPHQPKKEITFSIPLFDDTKLVELKIHIVDQVEIETHINNVKEKKRAWIVIPSFETSGLFQSSGKITLWIHANPPREILKMRVQIPYVGHVTTELYEIRKLEF